MLKRFSPLMLILTLLLIPAFLVGLALGSVFFSPTQLIAALRDTEGTTALILFEIRLPRLLLGMAVGAALAVSGAAFQGIFRNSLADPYVIGASSGAALGATIAVSAGLTFVGPVSPISLCAFCGALIAVALAFIIARSAGNQSPVTALLLAGTALSALFSSLLSLILLLKDQAFQRVYFWLLGSLNGTTWSALPAVLPVMALGCLIVFLHARPLDLLLQGEDVAESLGLEVRKTRAVIAFGAALATAAAVSASGVIGFVGLIAPHTMRLLIGPSHKRLLPSSALAGALLVLVADCVARSAAGSLELPIGIITSLCGAPFFIWLLIRHSGRIGRL
ncbi:MAG: iron ABC transporter permease [Treponema sp.]|jgi:iron complex transport system permease protein|nr:iron ABC transporter permease [Treponema sp.]